MTPSASAPTLRGRRPILPVVSPAQAMTFSGVRAQVVRALAFQGASPLTIAQYEVCYGQVFGYLTVVRGLTDDMRHVTDEHVRGFAEWAMAQGVRANTIRNKLSALSTFARVAMTLRDPRGKPCLDHDPTRTFAWPRLQRRESKYLYAGELKALWEAPCSPALAIARELLIDTGARVSSLVNAEVGDVQEVGPDVFLRLKVKGGRLETVPLSAPAAKRLRDALWARGMPDPGERLLVRPDGRPWTRTALSEAIVRLGRAAGITRFRVSAHKLRHTNNVFARGAGLDEYTRAKLLTHASTATLKVYDHEIPGELARARERQRQHLEAETGRVMDAGFVSAADDDADLRGFI